MYTEWTWAQFLKNSWWIRVVPCHNKPAQNNCMLRSALLYRRRISAFACAALPRLASAATASSQALRGLAPRALPRRALSSKSGAPDIENEDMLKLRLTPLQYEVCRNSGTEPPFSNEYWNHKGMRDCFPCNRGIDDIFAVSL
jgi:hypothetical protein